MYALRVKMGRFEIKKKDLKYSRIESIMQVIDIYFIITTESFQVQISESSFSFFFHFNFLQEKVTDVENYI